MIERGDGQPAGTGERDVSARDRHSGGLIAAGNRPLERDRTETRLSELQIAAERRQRSHRDVEHAVVRQSHVRRSGVVGRDRRRRDRQQIIRRRAEDPGDRVEIHRCGRQRSAARDRTVRGEQTGRGRSNVAVEHDRDIGRDRERCRDGRVSDRHRIDVIEHRVVAAAERDDSAEIIRAVESDASRKGDEVGRLRDGQRAADLFGDRVTAGQVQAVRRAVAVEQRSVRFRDRDRSKRRERQRAEAISVVQRDLQPAETGVVLDGDIGGTVIVDRLRTREAEARRGAAVAQQRGVRFREDDRSSRMKRQRTESKDVIERDARAAEAGVAGDRDVGSAVVADLGVAAEVQAHRFADAAQDGSGVGVDAGEAVGHERQRAEAQRVPRLIAQVDVRATERGVVDDRDARAAVVEDHIGAAEVQALRGARAAQQSFGVLDDADVADRVHGQRAEIHRVTELLTQRDARAAEAGVVLDRDARRVLIGDRIAAAEVEVERGARAAQESGVCFRDRDLAAGNEGERAELIDVVERDSRAVERGVVLDDDVRGAVAADRVGAAQIEIRCRTVAAQHDVGVLSNLHRSGRNERQRAESQHVAGLIAKRDERAAEGRVVVDRDVGQPVVRDLVAAAEAQAGCAAGPAQDRAGVFRDADGSGRNERQCAEVERVPRLIPQRDSRAAERGVVDDRDVGRAVVGDRIVAAQIEARGRADSAEHGGVGFRDRDRSAGNKRQRTELMVVVQRDARAAERSVADDRNAGRAVVGDRVAAAEIQTDGRVDSSQLRAVVFGDADGSRREERQRTETDRVPQFLAQRNARGLNAGVLIDGHVGGAVVGDRIRAAKAQPDCGARAAQHGGGVLGDADGSASIERQRAEVN